ncbi:MAG: hypothetical protein WAN14_20680 [Candidatus Acidiferrales bacterium]
MRKLLFFVLFVVCLPPAAKAQATLIPAGTLLHCTIDDPTISPKTAEVGDPVLCHLSQFTEFGRAAFPRGSYLAGHLEASKQPGHFIGKGYLNIVFDHIGLPNTDSDLNARIVAAQGQHVDKQGDIVGHGHAKRDVIEWMIPPLWPWKVVSLPARGPQPKLKNEQLITLKVMQDVELPQLSAYLSPSPLPSHYYGGGNAAPRVQSYTQPSGGGPLASQSSSRVYYVAPSTPATDPPASLGSARAELPSRDLTLVALKSEMIYPARDYWVAGRLLFYVLPDGSEASADLSSIDWQRTTDLNAERGVRVTLRTNPSHF